MATLIYHNKSEKAVKLATSKKFFLKVSQHCKVLSTQKQ